MRYFRILSNEKIPQPRFKNWYRMVPPGRWEDKKTYEELGRWNSDSVEMEPQMPFMDLIIHPLFMVSGELANLIRVYYPGIRFKYMMLHNERNRQSAVFQIPDLMEVDCLTGDCELSRDKREVLTKVLSKEKIRNVPIFRLGGVQGRYIMANMGFVESAYRREVMGMRVEEFRVE